MNKYEKKIIKLKKKQNKLIKKDVSNFYSHKYIYYELLINLYENLDRVKKVGDSNE